VQSYSASFFQTIAPSGVDSARVIAPRLIELVQPRSIVVVGCGTGSWLRVFKELGVEDVLGIDGSYVPANARELPAQQFLERDLTQPLRLDRRFDLVMSLEVAEHLPPDVAEQFVESLVNLGPVVAFSAAVPKQGGTHHVNEQWPEYWAGLFARHRYSAIDCFRADIWRNPRVAWYYAQNLLLFASDVAVAQSKRLRDARSRSGDAPPLSIVHPRPHLHRCADLATMMGAAEELSRLVQPGEPFIFVDQDELRPLIAVGSRAVPFMERDGQFWGAPADDQSAIAELERLRSSAGVRLLIFASPAFWWLEEYAQFHRHIQQSSACVMRSEYLIAFDLTANAEPARHG
jgi:SAM-dependent methyltransferase